MNPTLQGVKQRFGIIGNSQALNHAIQIAMRVAPTDLSVLIQWRKRSGKGSLFKNSSSTLSEKARKIHCRKLWSYS